MTLIDASFTDDVRAVCDGDSDSGGKALGGINEEVRRRTLQTALNRGWLNRQLKRG